MIILPTLEFSPDIEISPLPMKSYKFGPVLGTYGHLAVRINSGACQTYCDTGASVFTFLLIISEEPVVEHLAAQLLLPGLTT